MLRICIYLWTLCEPRPLEVIHRAGLAHGRPAVADLFVVQLDRARPVGDLLYKIRALEKRELLLAPEDGHVGQSGG